MDEAARPAAESDPARMDAAGQLYLAVAQRDSGRRPMPSADDF
ncbi:hypothetical protein [Mycobacterium sp. pW045]